MAKVNRKLATILATDCVDFSKFMETQEELTLANLSSCREIIDPIIEEHGGRIFIRRETQLLPTLGVLSNVFTLL